MFKCFIYLHSYFNFVLLHKHIFLQKKNPSCIQNGWLVQEIFFFLYINAYQNLYLAAARKEWGKRKNIYMKQNNLQSLPTKQPQINHCQN